MKLKKMEIIGFKSFVDKACIEFPEGISAIVGPNGCGKSNIVDAIRWVMGEQSVKQLRGKNMNDLIFAGTSGKPALNMAEVTLTLSNDNGSAPEELKDFTEIMLTRRLFRSGDSGYFLNKRPCRLKDIHNIFLGSGMGTKSFSIIQQGNIGAITDAGPDDRRHYIEEAAGITRYKSRKKDTQRKLAQTRQNLLRVDDILAEVKRQMGGLKRQAKKAERYRDLQKQIQRVDIVWGLKLYQDHTRQINHCRRMLKELKDADLQHTACIRQLDAAVEAIKIKRFQQNERISSQKNQMNDIQRTIDRLENDSLHLDNTARNLSEEINSFDEVNRELIQKSTRIDAEIDQARKDIKVLSLQAAQTQSELDQKQSAAHQIKDRQKHLQDTLEVHKNRLMKLAAQEAQHKNIHQTAAHNKENIQRRLKRIDEETVLAQQKVQALEQEQTVTAAELKQLELECSDCTRRIEDLKHQLESAHLQLNDQIKKVQHFEMVRNKHHSRYSALKKMNDNYEWYKGGAQAIMKRHLAGLADSPPDLSPSGDTKNPLDGVIGMVGDMIDPEPEYQTAVEAALGDFLQYIVVEDPQAGAMGVDYLQMHSAGRSGFVPLSAFPEDSSASPLPNSQTRLLDHIAVKPEFKPIAETLFGHFIATDSLEAAIERWQANGRSHTFITPSGDMVTHQGIITGGSQDNLPGILSKKHELKQLAHALTQIEQELEGGQSVLRLQEDKVRDLEQELQAQLSEKSQLASEETELEKKVYKITEALKHARRLYEISQLEQEQLYGEECDLEEEIRNYNQLLGELADDLAEAQQQVTASSGELETLSLQAEAEEQKVLDLKLQQTELLAKLDNTQQTARRLETFQKDSLKQLEDLKREIQRKTRRHDQSRQQISENERKLIDLHETLSELDESLEEQERDYAAIDDRLKQNDAKIAEIQNRRELDLKEIQKLELEKSQLSIKRETVENRLSEYYHQSIADLQMAYQEHYQASDQPLDEMEAELKQLKAKIHKLGEINLGAIQEYEELHQRFDFLESQRSDLLQAIEDLEKVIRKINRISQKMFTEIFELINLKLSEVFPRLFNGGSAQLELTDPSKPLETGVELLIHLPGKKLTRLSLLSGGEKALSAIAFVFCDIPDQTRLLLPAG